MALIYPRIRYLSYKVLPKNKAERGILLNQPSININLSNNTSTTLRVGSISGSSMSTRCGLHRLRRDALGDAAELN
jgi:hypothetical protein